MKNILVLFAWMVFSLPSFAQKAIYNHNLEEKIKQLDLAHARAILEGDVDGLDSLMDNDVTVNHPTGRIVKEKRALMEMIRSGVIRYTSYERHPERFIFFKDMVVVMGSEVVVPAASAPQAEKELHRRYTNLWMMLDGKWKITIRHANNVL